MCNICDGWHSRNGQDSGPDHMKSVSPGLLGPHHPHPPPAQGLPSPTQPPVAHAHSGVDASAAGTLNHQHHSRTQAATAASGTTRGTAWYIGDLTNVSAYRTNSGTVKRTGNDDDYRRFTLARTRRVRFELRNLSADANLFLESASGQVLQSSRRSGTANDAIVRILAAGTWYIRVDANAPGTIRYQLRYRTERAPDPGTTRESAWSIGDLTNVSAYRTKSGTVKRTGNDDDYRRFTLTRRRRVRFELRNLTADANLFLENASGQVLQSSRRSGTANDAIVRILTAGTWYIRVDANAPGTIRYQLRYRTERAPDPGTTRETAWNIGNLSTLTAYRTKSGTVNRTGNDHDYRRFTLTRRRRVRFELRNLSADANLFLENASGRVVQSSRRSGATNEAIVRILAAGTYHARVDANAPGTIRYQLRYRTERAPDPGTTRESAWYVGNLTNLSGYQTNSGTVNRTSDASDYRRFTLTTARTMRFELRNLSANADLFLEDASGRQLGASRNARTALDSVVHSLDAGTYYIRVDAIESGTIRYQLRYGHDAGTTPRTAINLGNLANVTATRTRSGTVNRDSNDTDYYRFTLSHARRMRFELRNLTADADLYLEDASGRELRVSNRSGTAADSIIASLAAGTYYLRADASGSGTIRYQLRYAHDRGSTPGTALNLGNLTNLARAGARSGSVDGNDTLESNDDNYYRFTLTAARAMRFELRSLTANANLYLEDASGRQLHSSENAGTAVDSILASLNPGTWYVRVDASASGIIRYQLHYARDEGGSTRLSAVNLGDLTNAAGVGERSGTVDSTGDRYYRFTLTVPREVRIELRNLTANADLYLEDASGRRLHASENSRIAVDSILAPLNAGTWYIRVDARDNASIGYQLRYAREEGSTPLSAFNLGDLTNLAAAGTRQGTVDTDSDDYYRFTLTAARAVRIELRNLTANANLYLEDASGRQLHSSVNAGTATESILAPLAAGTWYIRVDAADNAAIGYQLRYERDEGSTRQSAFNLGDLTNLAAAGTRSGTVETGDDDYYRFTLAAARVMRIELRNLTANADLYLEDAAGRQIRASTNARIAVDSLLVPLNAGTWYIRVNASESGSIGYQLRYARDEGSTPQSAIDLGDLTNIEVAGSRTGTVEGNDDDYYRFTLSHGRTMRFRLTGLTANVDLYLEDASGGQIRSRIETGTRSESFGAILATGTYYLRVDASASGTIQYNLVYERVRDGRTRTMAYTPHLDINRRYWGLIRCGFDYTTYRSSTLNGTVDRIGDDDSADRYYRVTAPESRQAEYYTLDVSLHSLGDANLYLEDASGRQIESSTNSGTSGESFESVRVNSRETYYIRVVAADRNISISYSLSFGFSNFQYYRERFNPNRCRYVVGRPPVSLTVTSQPLWRDDAMTAAGTARPHESRNFQGRDGMLSA